MVRHVLARLKAAGGAAAAEAGHEDSPPLSQPTHVYRDEVQGSTGARIDVRAATR
ncbi:hypothetical protein MNEG_12957 [Monoraphidium neglectum]|uniref:Uncharacterized protein n=1 Tax=Monoraphidium neglectum TaxID=145388 RepID=A0A0D2M0F9_9CHLO|nr:hypothetical protein MNEG_12957 [Monoraphidium neglectum]KIY95006.1 hypothetical protein MNEG_12957 [Monoraphidium neglectum]|eukprot:XP_013894026.1 hypothetical protein MNEG_12957 [Monoraphidium neglectum]